MESLADEHLAIGVAPLDTGRAGRVVLRHTASEIQGFDVLVLMGGDKPRSTVAVHFLLARHMHGGRGTAVRAPTYCLVTDDFYALANLFTVPASFLFPIVL